MCGNSSESSEKSPACVRILKVNVRPTIHNMPRNGGPIASRMAACQSDALSQAWWPKILNPRFSKALPTIITQTTRNTYSESAQRLYKSVLVHSDNIIKFSSYSYFILGPYNGQHSTTGKAMFPGGLKNGQRFIEGASSR